jgi:cytochrome c biogenesis protein ResB
MSMSGTLLIFFFVIVVIVVLGMMMDCVENVGNRRDWDQPSRYRDDTRELVEYLKQQEARQRQLKYLEQKAEIEKMEENRMKTHWQIIKDIEDGK